MCMPGEFWKLATLLLSFPDRIHILRAPESPYTSLAYKRRTRPRRARYSQHRIGNPAQDREMRGSVVRAHVWGRRVTLGTRRAYEDGIYSCHRPSARHCRPKISILADTPCKPQSLWRVCTCRQRMQDTLFCADCARPCMNKRQHVCFRMEKWPMADTTCSWKCLVSACTCLLRKLFPKDFCQWLSKRQACQFQGP